MDIDKLMKFDLIKDIELKMKDSKHFQMLFDFLNVYIFHDIFPFCLLSNFRPCGGLQVK